MPNGPMRKSHSFFVYDLGSAVKRNALIISFISALTFSSSGVANEYFFYGQGTIIMVVGGGYCHYRP